MSGALTNRRYIDGCRRWSFRSRQALAGAVLVALFAAGGSNAIQAAECPEAREPRIPAVEAPVPPATQPILNIDKLKARLLEYAEGKEGKPGNYGEDVAQVFGDARAYVESRAGQVKRPAVVLDIDETSLSNWINIKINNFGFIKGGPCSEEANLACGFDEWILKATAPPIPPALRFFNAAIGHNVAVFFITGRRHSQRKATMWNLDRAGFHGWAGLRMRRDDDHDTSIVPFKSGERKRIEENGYTIIANIGDQQSDIDGGSAECPFKVPNPFYFIK
jgi:hypothetical protein